VLAYLSRYTHRVAISSHRLLSADKTGVTFAWKDYRIEGPDRDKTMRLPTDEFNSALSDARAAQGLAPHPPLCIVRQRQSRRQHRTGA
jgi:Putative transposase